MTVAGYGEITSIPKAKSVNQSFHTSAECAFLYAGLHTFVALQVNVTENNRILRDGARGAELVVAGPCFVEQCWFGSFLADQLQ